MEITKIDDNHYKIKKGKDKVILTVNELDHLWRRINSLIRGEKRGGSIATKKLK